VLKIGIFRSQALSQDAFMQDHLKVHFLFFHLKAVDFKQS